MNTHFTTAMFLRRFRDHLNFGCANAIQYLREELDGIKIYNEFLINLI